LWCAEMLPKPYVMHGLCFLLCYPKNIYIRNLPNVWVSSDGSMP
jgi:hypothetical protein